MELGIVGGWDTGSRSLKGKAKRPGRLLLSKHCAMARKVHQGSDSCLCCRRGRAGSHSRKGSAVSDYSVDLDEELAPFPGTPRTPKVAVTVSSPEYASLFWHCFNCELCWKCQRTARMPCMPGPCDSFTTVCTDTLWETAVTCLGLHHKRGAKACMAAT